MRLFCVFSDHRRMVGPKWLPAYPRNKSQNYPGEDEELQYWDAKPYYPGELAKLPPHLRELNTGGDERQGAITVITAITQFPEGSGWLE